MLLIFRPILNRLKNVQYFRINIVHNMRIVASNIVFFNSGYIITAVVFQTRFSYSLAAAAVSLPKSLVIL